MLVLKDCTNWFHVLFIFLNDSTVDFFGWKHKIRAVQRVTVRPRCSCLFRLSVDLNPKARFRTGAFGFVGAVSPRRKCDEPQTHLCNAFFHLDCFTKTWSFGKNTRSKRVQNKKKLKPRDDSEQYAGPRTHRGPGLFRGCVQSPRPVGVFEFTCRALRKIKSPLSENGWNYLLKQFRQRKSPEETGTSQFCNKY